MGLIDVDELLKYKTDHDFIDTHIVWNAPRVEAIPIKWIEEWYKCLRENIYNVSAENLDVLRERYEEYLKMERLLSMMIEDWRKENETN